MKKTKNLLTKTCKCLLVFGIIFSQLSFPLSVLADEVLENNELNKVVEEQENEQPETSNGEITEENNTKAEEENTTEDSNNTEKDNITEEEAPTPEEEKGFTTEKLEQETENLYIIKNNSNKAVTVKKLKEIEENALITDKENTEVTDETKEVISDYQIKLINEEDQEVTYRIIVLADYNDDGIVSEEDQLILLDQLKNQNEEVEVSIFESDLNKDEKFDILDVTYPIFTEKSWENDKVATDVLENKLTTDEEVLVEDEIDVDYIVEGFTQDKLVGIQGILKYNKELLQLTKVTVNGVEEDILELENGNFAYLLNDYNTNGVLITFTFKALATIEEEVVVAMEDIIASIGGVTANIDLDSLSTSFKISDGKGGDVEDDTTGDDIPGDDTTEDNTTEEDNNKENIESTPETEPTPEQTVVTTPVVVAPTQTTNTNNYLSSDNYINSLTIKGHEIEFNKNTYEYSIDVKNDVSSLELTILLNHGDATYYVEGNENFKAGENIVKIIVTAENGNTRTYTIKVNKEEDKTIKEEKDDKEDDEEEEEKNSTSKTIIIILIILVIIGLIYVIFKDDEEEEQENNKNNTKNSQKNNKKASKK